MEAALSVNKLQAAAVGPETAVAHKVHAPRIARQQTTPLGGALGAQIEGYDQPMITGSLLHGLQRMARIGLHQSALGIDVQVSRQFAHRHEDRAVVLGDRPGNQARVAPLGDQGDAFLVTQSDNLLDLLRRLGHQQQSTLPSPIAGPVAIRHGQGFGVGDDILVPK
jgi:hypothetical protein